MAQDGEHVKRRGERMRNKERWDIAWEESVKMMVKTRKRESMGTRQGR